MTFLTEEQYLETLQKDTICFTKYDSLSDEWKRKFLDFMTGKKTLPLTYDPIFKRIFDCDVHPERLSRLISSIIGTDMEVVEILSNEGTLLDEESLLIMDIVVRLEDGSLANVEMQKIPYAFPGERMACYSSDLLLRQYSRVKAERKREFSYKDMRKVYTIIFFEQTEKEYSYINFGGRYIHHGSTVFDTGINVNLLQEYWIVSLDEFRKTPYPKNRCEQTAWISFLATEDCKDIDRLIEEYPWLEEIYREISEYLVKPGEVLSMFSEALRVMDKNNMKYMVDEMQKLIDEKNARLTRLDAELQKIDSELQEKDTELQAKTSALQEKDRQIAEQNAEMEKLRQQLAELQS